jgi:hypothetical protein
MSISLQINALYSVTTEPWPAVAAAQPAADDDDAITPDNFAEGDEGDIFAFEDRNMFDDPWRLIFVVLGEGCVYIFDDEGAKINEPDDNVADGCQALEGDKGFLTDWRNGYYRTAEQAMAQEAVEAAAEEAAAREEEEAAVGRGRGGGKRRALVDDDDDFEDVVREGARIKMCFTGATTAWFGGIMGSVNSRGWRIIGFDDGDLKAFPMEAADLAETDTCCSLREAFNANCLAPLDPADGGVIANERHNAEAAAFVTYKDRTKTKTIGLLVGACGTLCDDLPMYQYFYIAPGVFATPAAPAKPARRSSARSQADSPSSMQDRQGLHSFRRGDVVQYQQTNDGEPVCQAVIYACCYQPSTDAAQARKLLVLYDQQADIFFLGAWPAWRRVSKRHTEHEALNAAPFDCDDDDQVRSISMEECVRMNRSFDDAPPLASSVPAAVRHASQPPPQVRELRDGVKKREREEERERKRVEREEERKRERAAREEEECEGERERRKKPPPKLPPKPPKPPPPKLPPKPPPRDPSSPRDASPLPERESRRSPRGHAEPSPSPPGSVRKLKKLIRGLKTAQAVPGQAPAELAARAQELDGYECDLEERERKYRKYGKW